MCHHSRSVSWSLAEDLSAFPSVAALDKVVGHPVVVISLSVTAGVDGDVVTNSVSDKGGGGNEAPILVSEDTALPVRGHSWASTEDHTETKSKTEHLNGETSVATLSLEKITLGKEVLLWGLDDLVGSDVVDGGLLPVGGEGTLPDSESVVSR